MVRDREEAAGQEGDGAHHRAGPSQPRAPVAAREARERAGERPSTGLSVLKESLKH